MQDVDLLKQYVWPKPILLIWCGLGVQLRTGGGQNCEKGGNVRHAANTIEGHYAPMTDTTNSRSEAA